jgi:hypothetical protein
MKQDENEQNYKKGSTLVVGQKPNGKSRLMWLKRGTKDLTFLRK